MRCMKKGSLRSWSANHESSDGNQPLASSTSGEPSILSGEDTLPLSESRITGLGIRIDGLGAENELISRKNATAGTDKVDVKGGVQIVVNLEVGARERGELEVNIADPPAHVDCCVEGIRGEHPAASVTTGHDGVADKCNGVALDSSLAHSSSLVETHDFSPLVGHSNVAEAPATPQRNGLFSRIQDGVIKFFTTRAHYP
jgi:hypothetical protein